MAILGELETRIMENLWQQGKPASVREIHENLLNEKPLAYTTVMTVLDRLAKKGVVHRERSGRAWLYTPARTRAELVVTALVEALADARDEQADALAGFAGALTDSQRAQLRRILG
ncbi:MULTISPECIES: BlaI/MecI/CopY family transcriptional regulator [unclassified Luteococcus]|uniref:BlaI/MecI/CopY family transcriptional regulator n=1 Tax=unclassified Luteococcus TaxID=2639923 RepID=UPI00313C3CA9